LIQFVGQRRRHLSERHHSRHMGQLALLLAQLFFGPLAFADVPPDGMENRSPFVLNGRDVDASPERCADGFIGGHTRRQRDAFKLAF
jgi:hypothetical protein